MKDNGIDIENMLHYLLLNDIESSVGIECAVDNTIVRRGRPFLDH